MQPTTRRRFIQQTSLFSAGLIFAPDGIFKLNKKIGIQLYTVRDLMGKDPKGTIQKVAAIGYQEIESFGYNKGKYFGLSPKEFADLAKQNHLTHPSAHYSLANLRTDWDKAIEDAKVTGQKYMVIAYLDASERKTIDDYKRLAREFNTGAEKCKKAGIQFAYHNHDFEFIDMNGQHGYEILLKEIF